MGYFYKLCKIKFYWLRLKKQSVLYHISRAAKLWVWLAAKVQPVRRKFQGWGSLTWNVLPNTPIFPNLLGGGEFELQYYEESCLNPLSVDTLKSWGSQLFFFKKIVCHIPMTCQAAGPCLFVIFLPAISAHSPKETGNGETCVFILIAVFLAVDWYFLQVDHTNYIQSFPSY